MTGAVILCFTGKVKRNFSAKVSERQRARPGMHTTTMKRIAGELGVSITTVSKVLNNHADIGAGDPRPRARQGRRARLPAQRRRAQPQPPPHPHARHRHSGSDALVLRRDHRRHRAGRQRPRLRPAALQLERGSRQGARGARDAPPAGRSTASSSPRRTRSGNTDLLQQLTTHGTSLVMIDRDDHPSVRCHRVRHRRRAGRPARDRRTCSISGAGRSRTSAARRSSTPSGATTAARDALEGARASRRRATWIVRGGFMESDGYRAMKRLLDGAAARSTRCSRPTIRAAIGAMKAMWEAG